MEERNKMTLDSWMGANRLTNGEMADLLDCSIGTIVKWRYGKIPWVWRAALRIQKMTEGLVDLEQLVLHHREKKGENSYKQQDEDDGQAL